MNILYDHQIFTSQKYGGISRYFYELIKEFDDVEDIKIKASVLLSNNYYISDKYYVKYINFLPNIEFTRKNGIMTRVNKINSIYQIKKQNFDIFHPTYYDRYFLKFIGIKPFVLTVYDMIYEKLKDMFPLNGEIVKNKKTLCEMASKIIAISESTKKDLIELFGVDESKIEVIYLGNSMVLDNEIALNIEVPQRYILFVGSRDGYKNFNRFIRSVSLVLNEDITLSVVCVGGGKFNNNEVDLFKKLNIESRVFQYNVDDNVLAKIYAKACMFVFPSLYEGFGIPILESFACKCPLVCSNTSSLPEIAGDGAEYFDPYREESIYNAIKTVVVDDVKKELLVQNGTERLKHFSWKKTAKQTKLVYEMVVK